MNNCSFLAPSKIRATEITLLWLVQPHDVMWFTTQGIGRRIRGRWTRAVKARKAAPLEIALSKVRILNYPSALGLWCKYVWVQTLVVDLTLIQMKSGIYELIGDTIHFYCGTSEKPPWIMKYWFNRLISLLVRTIEFKQCSLWCCTKRGISAGRLVLVLPAIIRSVL